eukprot:gene15699-21265_t
MPTEAQSAWRTIKVTPQPSGFAAEITGVDLSQPLATEALAEVKAAWAQHSVVVFPGQPLTLAGAAQAKLAEGVTIVMNKPVGHVSGQPEPGKTPAVRLLTD